MKNKTYNNSKIRTFLIFFLIVFPIIIFTFTVNFFGVSLFVKDPSNNLTLIQKNFFSEKSSFSVSENDSETTFPPSVTPTPSLATN